MSKTILIEEDVQGDQKILQSTLTLKGYKVVEVATGEGTARQAMIQLPDLILLDTQIPLRLETVKTLKKYQETADIPVWALTSNYLPGDQTKFIESGCEFYLMKPVGLANLLHFVHLIDEHFAAPVPITEELAQYSGGMTMNTFSKT